MALYKVIAEQKITKKVLLVVEANSEEESMDKVRNKDIVAAESTLDMTIDEFIPLETEMY